MSPKSVPARGVRKDGICFFMKKNKIDYRVSEEQYRKISERAEKKGISTSAMARELMLESLNREENQDSNQDNKNLSYATVRTINNLLIQVEHITESIPNSFQQKELIKEKVGEIWLLLN